MAAAAAACKGGAGRGAVLFPAPRSGLAKPPEFPYLAAHAGLPGDAGVAQG